MTHGYGTAIGGTVPAGGPAGGTAAPRWGRAGAAACPGCLRRGVALLLEPLGQLRDFWEEASAWGQLPEQLFQPLLKTVCIALICRTGSDLCRDAGEGALASVLETAGAVAAIVVSLPLFRAVWDLLESLL